MTKRPIVGRVLKLLLVVALMAWVFSSVHLEDRLVWRRQGEELRSVATRIEGPWNTDEVVVRNGDVVERVHAGPQADGTELSILPGLLCYWRNTDPWLFALGAFCYFLTVVIAGARWWWLLRVNGMAVSLGESLRLTWIGVFFNNVVPGATGGDLIKALYIMKRCPGHRVPALVSVIVDRVLGLGSLAMLAAIVVLFSLDRFGDIAVKIWAVILGLSVLAMFAFSRRLRSFVRLKPLLDRLPHRVGNLLKLVDQAVYFYRGHKRVIAASLIAGIGNHVVSIMSVVWIGDALGVGLPLGDYFVLIPIINILSAIPLAPNGWGFGEWLYQSMFSAHGHMYVAHAADPRAVMGTRGVALSLLYRLHLTLWSLFGGLFVMFEKDRVTQADIDQEIALEQGS